MPHACRRRLLSSAAACACPKCKRVAAICAKLPRALPGAEDMVRAILQVHASGEVSVQDAVRGVVSWRRETRRLDLDDVGARSIEGDLCALIGGGR